MEAQIPSIAKPQWVKGSRVAAAATLVIAVAWIQSLGCELPYDARVAIFFFFKGLGSGLPGWNRGGQNDWIRGQKK